MNECLKERGPWAQSSSLIETAVAIGHANDRSGMALLLSMAPSVQECDGGGEGVTGVSGEARELRGDHPFKVLGYFRRRGAGVWGTWQTLLFHTQA